MVEQTGNGIYQSVPTLVYETESSSDTRVVLDFVTVHTTYLKKEKGPSILKINKN